MKNNILLIYLIFLPLLACSFETNRKMGMEPLMAAIKKNEANTGEALKRYASSVKTMVDNGETRDGLALKQINQKQQQMQSVLGVAVDELAEDIIGVQSNFDALGKVYARMENKLQLSVDLNNTLNTKIGEINQQLTASAEMYANLTVALENQIRVNTRLQNKIEKMEVKLSANTKAVVGYNKETQVKLASHKEELQKVNQSFSGSIGRDVTNNTFTTNALKAVTGAYDTVIWVCFFGLIFAILAMIWKDRDNAKRCDAYANEAKVMALALPPNSMEAAGKARSSCHD